MKRIIVVKTDNHVWLSIDRKLVKLDREEIKQHFTTNTCKQKRLEPMKDKELIIYTRDFEGDGITFKRTVRKEMERRGLLVIGCGF